MREEGQTMAEYAVVLAVITLAIVTIFAVTLSGAVTAAIQRVVNLI
jgi:Flp pilus assembly pilin Flp